MPALPDELFDNPIWLAPMAGVTEMAFRTLCLEHGAGLTYTEMVSAKALEYDSTRTHELTEPAPAEKKIAVQLFGHEPDVMARQAAALAQEMGERLAFIDVNMGCPVAKVHKKGEGAALMRDPALAAEIIAAMVAALEPYGVCVTAKFRSGWTREESTAVEFAKRLEAAGAAALGVHGRSATQMYKGKADWGIIAQVVNAADVPVIGSGDVMSHEDALAMMRECGTAAVFAARGARGNPWIFTGQVPTTRERIQAALRHLELYVQFHGSDHLQPLRAQLSYYLHGQAHATDVRRALSAAVTREDFQSLLEAALQRCEGE